MERQFIKRDTRNQKLLAGGSLSPVILDYIMDSEVPRPCRHFLGREEELDELHAMLEENSKVFLYGIAGIGKSELAKAYAKQYKKYYTNILYVEYAGDLHQAVTDMDFTDDLPEDGEEERFRKRNRFLRSLKDAQTWGTLWNRKYRGKLLMKDSYRDSYGTALIWAHRKDLEAGKVTVPELMNDYSPNAVAMVEKNLKALKPNIEGWEADFGKEPATCMTMTMTEAAMPILSSAKTSA